nr:DUF262 domain-containing protein [Dendronalium sp. ChiSLP03b]MDZ8207099.1 DUF262 domain-containing protein [Dendronalium sp. ChiSLP03b]
MISSILMKYPIPLILLAERPQIYGSGKYEIVDGMQRLNAVFGFIENSFAYQKQYFDINEFSYAKQLSENGIFPIAREKDFNILSRQECADITDYQLAVTYQCYSKF